MSACFISPLCWHHNLKINARLNTFCYTSLNNRLVVMFLRRILLIRKIVVLDRSSVRLPLCFCRGRIVCIIEKLCIIFAKLFVWSHNMRGKGSKGSMQVKRFHCRHPQYCKEGQKCTFAFALLFPTSDSSLYSISTKSRNLAYSRTLQNG
jgi:hypothetical protein